MGFESYMQFLNKYLNTFFSGHIGMFTTAGLVLFKGFATMIVVWAGVKTALSSSSGNSSFDFGRFAELLLAIAFCYAMINYYNGQAIPGIGYSFHDLITQESESLAHSIGQSTSLALFDKLDNLTQNLYAHQISLSIFEVQDLMSWLLIVILIGLLEFVTFAVIGFGYIAVTVLGIVGPIFIPFFLVPKLDFLFWGWLKSFMQYAFYPVVANAVLLVVAEILLHFLNILPGFADSWSTLGQAWGTLPFLIILIPAGIFGILKIPSLVNHLFSGSSGEGGAGMVAAALSAIRGGL